MLLAKDVKTIAVHLLMQEKIKALKQKRHRLNLCLGKTELTMLRELIGVQPKTNPTLVDRLFKADPYAVEARRQMGMQMSSDKATAARPGTRTSCS